MSAYIFHILQATAQVVDLFFQLGHAINVKKKKREKRCMMLLLEETFDFGVYSVLFIYLTILFKKVPNLVPHWFILIQEF